MNEEKNTPETQAANLLIEALIREQKKNRQAAYIRYGLLAFVGLSYLGAFIWQAQADDSRSAKPYAALVKVEGQIIPGSDASIDVLRPVLRRAFSDKEAKGVVLVINSPGGTPVQSSEIHDLIVKLKKEYNKPVIAIGEDLMASGAYMIAVAADHIFVNRSTVAGSIGVVSRGFGFTGLMEKLGIERRVATAGEAKNLLDPFSEQTPQDKEKQAELLASIHEHFKDVVKQGRGDRLNLQTAGLFSGTVWTGEQAVAIGLADKIGGLDDALSALDVKEAVRYAPPRSLLETLTSNMRVNVSINWATPETSGSAIHLLP